MWHSEVAMQHWEEVTEADKAAFIHYVRGDLTRRKRVEWGTILGSLAWLAALCIGLLR